MAGGGGEAEVYDVVVVGGGIMGSCAAYACAGRGARTLLLERHDLLHHLGSSHGESRTLRATYAAPHYPPLVLRAADLWSEAESQAGYTVVTPTPHLDLAPSHHPAFTAAIRSSAPHPAIGLQPLDLALLPTFFSGAFHLPDNWSAAVSRSAGVIKPTKAVAMFHSLALSRGATLRDRTHVTDICRDEASGNLLRISSGSTSTAALARKCIITAGAWTRELVKKLTKGAVDLPIQPVLTRVFYWMVKEGWEEKLTPAAGFPTFASYGDPYIYGTPSMEFPGLIKVAFHGGCGCDPDRRDWAEGAAEAEEKVRGWIREVMERCVEADEGPVMKQCCLYSMTPDEDFIIDFVGGELGRDVVVGGGFSGHGFKMAPAVGEILADLAISGEAQGVDLAPFTIARF